MGSECLMKLLEPGALGICDASTGIPCCRPEVDGSAVKIAVGSGLDNKVKVTTYLRDCSYAAHF